MIEWGTSFIQEVSFRMDYNLNKCNGKMGLSIFITFIEVVVQSYGSIRLDYDLYKSS